MDFTIDYGSMNLSARDTELYASVDGRVAHLANGEVVFWPAGQDGNHVMTVQVLQAMELCREFRSLDEHIGRIVQQLPGLQGQHDAVRRVLEFLRNRGLLVSATDFLKAFTQVDAVEPAPFFGLCIRACDRPAMVQRLLASVLEHRQRYGSAHRVLLVDDSQDAGHAATHAALLREYAERSGQRADYLGRDGWDACVGLLARAHGGDALKRLLQRDPAFAGRRGGGIGKNLITLLTAGHRYALLDDDFILPLHRHPEFAAGLAFRGGLAPRTFASPDAALEAGVLPDNDPLAEQLAVCGRPLAAALGQGPGLLFTAQQLKGLAPSTLRTLNGAAPVSMTVNGHRGSAGASGMGWLFTLDAAGRAGLVADRDTYLRGLDDPAVWFGARAWRVTTGGNFTPFLVDNGSLTPCTSPHGRSEDALFNALLSLSRRGSVVLEAPYAIGHRQEPGRERAALLKRPETPDVNLYFAELARDSTAALKAADPARRLQGFAGVLRDLGAASEADAAMAMREFLGYVRSRLVESLQRTLETAKEPPIYWAADLRAVVEVNAKAVIARGEPRFAGWPEAADAAACVAAMRGELDDLADGLELWPAAWDAARAQQAALHAQLR